MATCRDKSKCLWLVGVVSFAEVLAPAILWRRLLEFFGNRYLDRENAMSGERRWFLSVAIGCISLGSATCAFAQITPDSTLSNNSSVKLERNTRTIEGGTRAGGNLFHSFESFSVPTGSVAYFNNAQDIQNIISRVTGGSVSNIDGLIRANGTANLFLINPSGIIFGPNVALNIGGSFLATTASSMRFQDGIHLSATVPTPLLTVSVPIGLGFTGVPGDIRMHSSYLFAGDIDNFQDFVLVGGNVALNRTDLIAPSRRVELGGVSGGTVGLNVNGNNLSLSFPVTVTREDISIRNDSELNVVGAGGGNITIHARNLDVLDSILLAGINLSFTASTPFFGDITLDTTEQNRIGQNSLVTNAIFRGSTGNSGNINIKAKSLLLEDRARVGNFVFGSGNAGNVFVQASDLIWLGRNTIISNSIAEAAQGKAGEINIQTSELSLTDDAQIGSITYGRGNGGRITIQADSVSLSGKLTAILSSVDSNSVGQGGEIRIQARSLSLTDNAGISGSTSGRGNAASISISARDSISLFNGNITSRVGLSGVGVGGDIDITTGSLLLTQSTIANDAEGVGNAGNITIQADSITLTDDSALSATTYGQGKAGDISVQADNTISFSNSNIFTVVYDTATGRGGNINLLARSISLDESRISSNSFGNGNSGNIFVQARDAIALTNNSAFVTGVAFPAIGDGGDIKVQSKSLSLTNGSQLFAATFGMGKAGNIELFVSDSVNLSGVSTTTGFSSGLLTNTESGAIGQGGDIKVTTGTLQVSEGAVLSALTRSDFKGGSITVDTKTVDVTSGGQILTTAFKRGNAGNLIVNATDRITLLGSDASFFSRLLQFGQVDSVSSASGLFANTELGSTGNGGTIFIDPQTITIRNGAKIAVDSQGTGVGGNIQIQAGTLNLDNQALISAGTASNTGGNITLQLQKLLSLRRNSSISTNAGTAQKDGNGGNITINVPFMITVPKENSDISANAFIGRGGNVDITANGIFGIVPQKFPTEKSDITASSELGVSGEVNINTPDTDPSRGLVQLPSNLVDASQQIAQGCTPRGEQTASRFIATGRGGLPLSPNEPLRGRTAIAGWVDLPQQATQGVTDQLSPASVTKSTHQIVEAQGWIVDANGGVILVAQSPQSSSIPSVMSCNQ